MIEIRYTGTDGSVWDLRRGDVRLTSAGIAGLGNPDVEWFTRESPMLDGQSLSGWKLKPRPVFLPMLLGADTWDEDDWLPLDRAWWAANALGEYGTLRVTAPDGTWRELLLRFADDGGQPFPADPSTEAFYVMGINYLADDPWWRGPSLAGSFAPAGTPTNFLGGVPVGSAGLAPPIVLGSAHTVESAVIANPGDVAAWPLYRIRGPVSSFRSTVDGGVVSTLQGVDSGATLTIDTDPRVQTAILRSAGGTLTNVTPGLVDVDFRPIPRGSSVPLDIRIVGSGSVEVVLAPRYRKAW